MEWWGRAAAAAKASAMASASTAAAAATPAATTARTAARIHHGGDVGWGAGVREAGGRPPFHVSTGGLRDTAGEMWVEGGRG